jgi:hypothetical protein
MIYNISDEPTYGFKRKVEVANIHIGLQDFADKAVNLYLTVKYYEADDTPITIIPPKGVILRADNTTWVDVDGNIVPEGDIAAVMTEYEFFMAMMNVPIVISDIVEAKVAWADSLGRFN